jgi:hypothetical protein
MSAFYNKNTYKSTNAATIENLEVQFINQLECNTGL